MSSSNLNEKHPLYAENEEDWAKMRHTYAGERVVKDHTTDYLPATSGMRQDGMVPGQAGYGDYIAYLTRAVFPDYVSDGVEAAIGKMHLKPATINLPSALEPLREKATVHGESLQHLLRRMNEQQLVVGRLGLLLDVAPNSERGPLPYIATYNAEHIINWDGDAQEEGELPQLNMVVLDESGYERDGFKWTYKQRHRVLMLDGNQYVAASFKETLQFNPAELAAPMVRGKTLPKVPFVFVNTKDALPTPDNPPLLGLANLALAIYRGEADYRQNLFLQAQDTLVTMGSPEEDHRIGAGATINLPQGGDAKFIGVSAEGLGEQRQALENDRKEAGSKAGQLIDTSSREKESGEALGIRIAAQTATLTQIAQTSAGALEQLLRVAAEWFGANPDEVEVLPNLDFVDDSLAGKELLEYMQSRTLGAPLSLKSVHRLMQEKGLTVLEFEDEMKLLEDEEPADGGGGTGTGVEDDDGGEE